jgi:hypothetical protein
VREADDSEQPRHDIDRRQQRIDRPHLWRDDRPDRAPKEADVEERIGNDADGEREETLTLQRAQEIGRAEDEGAVE